MHPLGYGYEKLSPKKGERVLEIEEGIAIL